MRIFGLEGGGTSAEILAFTPLVAVASLMPLLVACVLRAWPAAAMAAIVAVVLVVAVVPRGFGGQTNPVGSPGPTLRVLAANMKVGEGDAGELVDLVDELDVDVLSVEELTPPLADDLKKAGLLDLLPHRILRTRTGSSGEGLYTRMPTGTPTIATLPGGFPLISAPLDVSGAPPIEMVAVHTMPPTNLHWERRPPRAAEGRGGADTDHDR